MSTENKAIDNMWDVFLFPITGLFSLLPSSVTKRIKRIPIDFIWFCLKIIWMILFWSYVATLVWPYFLKLSFVMDLYVFCAGRVLSWYLYLRLLWEGTTFSPLGMFFSAYSAVMIGFKTVLSFSSVKPKQSNSLISKLVSTFPASLNGYIGERAMKGSELIPAQQLPSFQCFIHRAVDGEAKEFLGMGFRIENAILTAYHVLAGYDQFVITTNVSSIVVDADKARGFPMEDVAYFLLEERDFSMLGMAKATLLEHAVPDDHPIYCQIFGPGTPVSYTMGTVESAKNFGKVVYSGSTGKGFSGSPYIIHKQVVGMHLGAGVLNLGVDAAFLRMLLSTSPEDTEDWLMQELERDVLKGKKVEWRHSPGDPEEVYVKRQGRYFVMAAEDFFDRYQPHSYVETLSGVNARLSPTYDDSKNESQAPGLLNANAGAVGTTLENEFSAPSHASNQPSLTPMPINPTAGMILNTEVPAQMPVLRNEVSSSMWKNTSFQPEKSQPRKQRWRKKRSQRLSGSSQPGSPGLEMIR